MSTISRSQVVFNEGSNRNYTQLADTDNDFPDWLELYNTGTAQTMTGYFLSDSKSELTKWTFPSITIAQNQWMLVFASGKYTASNVINHWETAVNDNDTWQWTNPTAGTSSSWTTVGFDASTWSSGQGGFGFGDGDDNTTFSNTNISVYSRKIFSISDTSIINGAVLHMDYDDGFIAYLNGQEIARSNCSGNPTWNTTADNGHEALMYQLLNPEEYRLDMDLVKSVWKQGNNVLAIHVMNQSLASSDITSRGFLSFGIENTTILFSSPPSWFTIAASSNLHTNFKIAEKGETIYLSHGAGIIDDSLVVPGKLPLDASYGRTQDGAATNGLFTTATPNATNNLQTAYTNGFEPNPIVDKVPGFYPSAILISITTSAATAQIYYTLDGQTPTTSATLYTVPFTLSSSAVLIVKSFSTTGKLPSESVVNSYFINEVPTNAGIMCITTDDVNLYGPTGIYDNYTSDWKKPCYIEYFEPSTHVLAFEQRAGLKIDGGAGGSRSQPQRSFRVEPGNGTLGDGALKYPLQPFRPNRKEYETFYLRNGSNQYLYYPCKDAIETKCMAYGTDIPYSEYTAVQVYLNGQYWGWYELREKQDADYFLQNYGIDNDSLELLGASYFYGGVLRGIEGVDPVSKFNKDYNALTNLSTNSSSYWDDAALRFDLPNYIDYICMQSWIGNTDWPYNNIKIFSGPQTKHKWRFGIIDLEWSLEPNGWQNSSFDHIDFMKNYSTSFPYLGIWQKSINNTTFKDNFINRFADLMNTNWLVDSLHKIANSRYDETKPELPKTFERWGNPFDVSGQMATFDNAHQTMLSELAARSTNVRGHILSNFNLPKEVTITLDVAPVGAGKIKISTVKPSVYPWTGIYFDGIPVAIEAIANPGYTFNNWTYNSLLSSLTNKLFLDTLTSSATFNANFVTNTFTNAVTISEINYNSASTKDAEDWVEFWNYSKTKSADMSGWYFMDEENFHRYTFPSATILNANTRLVVVKDDLKFTAQYPTIAHLSNFDFSLGNSGDAIRLYDYNDNVIAIMVYDDVAPWTEDADGTSKTLELRDSNLPINAATNWFAGCNGGSPGKAFVSPCTLPTDIKEVYTQSVVSIHPNPTQGKFNISCSGTISNVSILNYIGKEIYTTTELTEAQELDLTAYPQGIYLIKVTVENSTQQTLTVLKY